MGDVYCVTDLELEVLAALKTIRPEIASNPSALRLFKQEVLLARSVTHTNVCRIYDLGRHYDGRREVAFLTMEFLPGDTLAARIAAQGKLSRESALPIIKQLADGLDAAHRAGIVHRDFKSANVLLVPSPSGERVVITDFGLATGAQEIEGSNPAAGDPVSNQLVGTPAYMSPEQVRGDRAGPAADLYALGVVLFEVLTGQLPFRGRTPSETARLRLENAPPRPSALVELEPDWEEAILRLLSLEPSARFGTAREVMRALEGGAASRRSAETDATSVHSTRFSPHSLPAEHDAFVGRHGVLSSLAEELEPRAALVTLLGVGGMGKTRLARHYGWKSLERWPGGVWFCDLTEARDISGIAYSVAGALDVRLSKDDPIEQLGHALAGRGRSLVILDNFEQVAAHADATLGRWRARARESSFLVTTRERLLLQGETVLDLEPLDPESEGVELFEERARVPRPAFTITTENRATVMEIVRILDGLPLAIELAASRLQTLSLEQLRGRLSERFSVLSGTKPGRHGTLRATLDWSWSLLSPWEQSAAAQASVFQGGFTLEAAEAVIDLPGSKEAPLVLEVIQSLVDKSWLRARVLHQAPRFSMYATVQEYAAERLRSADAETPFEIHPVSLLEVQERHGRYFAAMGADDAIEALDRHGSGVGWAALRVELDNLIVACRAAARRGSAEIAGAIYLAAAAVLQQQGPLGVSVDLGLQVLSAIQGPTSRGRVLCSLALSERMSGRLHEARSHHEAALAIYRDSGNRHGEGIVLGGLGVLHQEQGRMAEARSHYQTALAIHREVGDRPAESNVLSKLAVLHQEQGRLEEARSHYEAALAIHREVGSRSAEGVILGNLAVLDQEQGRLEDARTHCEAALAIHREVGDRRSESFVLGNLGVFRREQGRTEEAQAHFEAALAIHRVVGDRRGEGIMLGNLGTLHKDQGRMEEARSHYEAALAIHREVGNRRSEGVVLGNLAVLYQEQGRLEEARSHYEAALAEHREVGNRRFEGIALSDLGELHMEQGRLEEARRCFDEGIHILQNTGDRIELGKILCKRGMHSLREGNLRAARSTLAEAEQMARIVEAAPESGLGREIAKLREGLSGETNSELQ